MFKAKQKGISMYVSSSCLATDGYGGPVPRRLPSSPVCLSALLSLFHCNVYMDGLLLELSR